VADTPMADTIAVRDLRNLADGLVADGEDNDAEWQTGLLVVTAGAERLAVTAGRNAVPLPALIDYVRGRGLESGSGMAAAAVLLLAHAAGWESVEGAVRMGLLVFTPAAALFPQFVRILGEKAGNACTTPAQVAQCVETLLVTGHGAEVLGMSTAGGWEVITTFPPR
jgi:hypothetical protein